MPSSTPQTSPETPTSTRHDTLRAQIAQVLRDHQPPTHVDSEGLPADEFDCCASAVLHTVLAWLHGTTEWGTGTTEWTYGSRRTDGGPGRVIGFTVHEAEAHAIAAAPREDSEMWERVALCRELGPWREAGPR